MLSKNNTNKTIVNIINVLIVLIAVYLPTSINTEIMGVSRLIVVWFALDLFILVFASINKFKVSQFVLSMIFINVYLFLISLLASTQFPETRISLARIAPIISLLFLFSLKIEVFPDYKIMRFLLNAISLTAIIWNVLLLAQNQFITNFSFNWFNQYYELNGYYQYVVYHKPVMSFGVHSYSAYFYFLFFVLCMVTYNKTNRRIYLVYSIFYIIFCVFLVSTTAFIFCIAMLAFLFIDLARRLTKWHLLALTVIVVVFFIVIYSNFDEIYQKLYINMTNGGNGFISRYSKNSVFSENFEVITSSLGIGYNIVDALDLGYSDSGFIVYLTMGNIPFAFAIYYLLVRFLNNNIPFYKKTLTLLILSFEVALPATFNYRFSYMILFVIFYMGALDSYCLSTVNGNGHSS